MYATFGKDESLSIRILGGIDWTGDKVLGDLDFADGICLINNPAEEMHTKTNYLSNNTNKFILFFNASKTEDTRANCDRYHFF